MIRDQTAGRLEALPGRFRTQDDNIGCDDSVFQTNRFTQKTKNRV
ncbi:hypothetical protein [Methylorubrum salsuginis]|uniref:Uncharacterized protein n=1 Tax=Methylorubrum salsuginis TaxID=414703 RepID=A0A1I4M8N9_9HYPH|nr:hypothetical protein [Methylorubrum salsuginis]SFL99317.1 hypothetical protein SAMN04488125_13524 [Methylorubrum salsuginis]